MVFQFLKKVLEGLGFALKFDNILKNCITFVIILKNYFFKVITSEYGFARVIVMGVLNLNLKMKKDCIRTTHINRYLH